MIIKTKAKIGKFIQNSSIDNIPLVEIQSLDELKKLSKSEYQIIDTTKGVPFEDLEKLKKDNGLDRKV